MTELTIMLDAKKRISLSRLLQFKGVTSIKASILENGDILLKPMAAIPTRENWVYENQDTLASLRRGLSAEGTIDLGSFAQYTANEE